jgi:hypothetical protein
MILLNFYTFSGKTKPALGRDSGPMPQCRGTAARSLASPRPKWLGLLGLARGQSGPAGSRWSARPSGGVMAQPSSWPVRGGGGMVRWRRLIEASSRGRAGVRNGSKGRGGFGEEKGEGSQSGRLTRCWSATSEVERSGLAAALEWRRRREALPLVW